jgi:hypothetical protein
MASADEGPISAFAPLPSSRPSEADAVFDLAAVPAARPEPASTGAVLADSKAALEAVIKSNGARVAALATTVTPRAAVASRPAGTDAASALDSGVKTTRKSPRPSARDTKPDPKPVVVAAQPQAARWVLHSDYVTTAGQNTTAPSFAYNIVRTAPRAVYTAGFQQGDQAADANRFSGKAVKFLSVARFQ